ncbi:hypothetical protein [Rummeliibacillus sp. SL167]|uniref:hypothetical protein n=1 Tax=Rummeliibacillus sp. SL167 TaxID=2579792 RepID=UPI001644FCA8|nr:hypothetical protein [Rummeliibacillus sp. SL167]
MRLIGSGGQDVGPSGVATGRGAFHFRSSISVWDEENHTEMDSKISSLNFREG